MSSTHMKFEKRVCELLYYLLFSTVIGKLQKKIDCVSDYRYFTTDPSTPVSPYH